jgi:hypothetical protein
LGRKRKETLENRILKALEMKSQGLSTEHMFDDYLPPKEEPQKEEPKKWILPELPPELRPRPLKVKCDVCNELYFPHEMKVKSHTLNVCNYCYDR